MAALLKNETVLREVEDDIASLFPGKAVQSYKELGIGDLRKMNQIVLIERAVELKSANSR